MKMPRQSGRVDLGSQCLAQDAVADQQKTDIWAGSYDIGGGAYANYGSAYSSGLSNVIVVPSQSNLTAGLYGLEAIVHEAMHQWDGEMFGALRAAAPNATVAARRSRSRRRERAEC